MQIYLDKLVESILVHLEQHKEYEMDIRLRSELSEDNENALRKLLAPHKLILKFPETAFFGNTALILKRDLIRVRRHGG